MFIIVSSNLHNNKYQLDILQNEFNILKLSFIMTHLLHLFDIIFNLLDKF